MVTGGNWNSGYAVASSPEIVMAMTVRDEGQVAAVLLEAPDGQNRDAGMSLGLFGAG